MLTIGNKRRSLLIKFLIMYPNRFLALAFFVLVFNGLNAQYNERKHTATDSILPGKHLNAYFMKGQQVGFRDIKPLLLQYPSSSKQFSKYRTQNTVSTIMLILGDAAAVAALFNTQSFNDAAPYLGGFVGGLAVGIPLSISAKKHFRKGVILYNQEMLK